MIGTLSNSNSVSFGEPQKFDNYTLLVFQCFN